MIWIQSDIHHTLHFLIQLSHTHTLTKEGGLFKDHHMPLVVTRWNISGGPSHPLPESSSLLRDRDRNTHRRGISKYYNAIFSFEEEGQHTHMMVASCSDCHHAATPILASNVDWLDHWCCVFVKLLNIWNLDVLICFCRSIFGLNLV